MGVCIKLATRSLRKNKGRTLITLMGIVLSVLMVCTIFTLLNSMLDSAIDSIIEKDGYWHIAVYNTTAEQIADLEAAEGVLSTQMISIDENDVFRITLKNPDEVYEFASRYLSETTEYSYHTELLSYLGISQSESIKSLIMGIAAALLPDLCLATSYMSTPAATEALSEFIFPFIGIDTMKSHFSLTSRLMPFPSEPITSPTPPS